MMGFLREIFGPSQDEVWGQLSSEIEADFIKGGFFRANKVVAKVKQWTITLDTYTVTTGENTVTYTRMRAPYVNKDGFRFTIYREGIFSTVGKLFGLQDIEVGAPDFDSEFIVKANDDHKVRELLANTNVRKLIQKQPSIHFEVKDDDGWFGVEFPESVDELYFQVPGVIKDIETLKNLYYLFAEVLNQLCNMDSAYENNPNINLQG